MKKMLVAVVVLGSVWLASCGPPDGIMRADVPRAYSDAEAQFLLQDYRGALEKFEAFVDQNPYSLYVSDARYWAGMCLLHLGDVKRARAHVERAYARPRTAFLKSLCCIALGDCDFADGMFRSAVSYYRRALDRPGTQRARILHRVGECYRHLGRTREARKYFARVAAEYPGSEYVEQEREAPVVSGGSFTVQVGAFGNRGNAEVLRTRLEKRGFSPFLRLVKRGGAVLCSVRVGRYKRWKDADAVARRVRAAGFDAVVIP